MTTAFEKVLLSVKEATKNGVYDLVSTYSITYAEAQAIAIEANCIVAEVGYHYVFVPIESKQPQDNSPP